MIRFLHIRTEDSDSSVSFYADAAGTYRVGTCSPALSFMMGWTDRDVSLWCRLQDWKITEISGGPNAA